MKEKEIFKLNGFLALIIIFAICGGLVVFVSVGAGAALAIILSTGFAVISPNEANVITFFGKYKGVIKQAGFWYTIPLSSSKRVSLKVLNFNSEKIKVNDLTGNPIDIAAVVTYKVNNSAKAVLDVESYSEFVQIQSETSIRHIASSHPYDSSSEETFSLRRNSDEVAEELKKDLAEKLSVAGVEVLEARIMNLAYSPEVATAMLQRQQAQAIIDARKVIVEGSVELVHDAIEKLQDGSEVKFSNEQKVTLANNLLIAIVSDKGVQPTMQINN